MQSAITTISGSFMPRVVTSGVPTRTPLGLNFEASSKGIEFRLRVMPTVSAMSCTCLPVRFCGRRSMSIKWLSVPPLTRRMPRSSSRLDSAFAFTTTCFAYSLKSGLSASPKHTALAAIACIRGPPWMPGKTAESIAFCQSARQRMIAPHAPRSVFCVVVLVMAACGMGDG